MGQTAPVSTQWRPSDDEVCFDDSNAFDARDSWQRQGFVEPRPNIDVVEIHAQTRLPNSQFAALGLADFDGFQLEDFRGSVFADDDCLTHS